MKNTQQQFETIFLKKEKASKDAYTFFFKRNKKFQYSYGQYIKMFLDIPRPDVRGSSRYFTVSSSPKEKDYFTITTRVIKSSFKKKLGSLRRGDKIKYFGPIGYFDFNKTSKKPKIFLAGGIGVTPYHSILTTLRNDKKIPKITLFASFPTKDGVVFYNEFKEIEESNSNIKIIYTLSREKKNGFETGRINSEMIKKYCPDFKKSEYFITGPEELVIALFEMIKSMGIKEKNIFKEDFPGY